jgi:hypothetical protein
MQSKSKREREREREGRKEGGRKGGGKEKRKHIYIKIMCDHNADD